MELINNIMIRNSSRNSVITWLNSEGETQLPLNESTDFKFDTMTDDFLKENYIPNLYQESVYAIEYKKLLSNDIRLISFDIDNTLATNRDKEPTKASITLIENLKKMGFKIILITNADLNRAKIFAEKFKVEYIRSAEKPLTRSFKRALTWFSLKPHDMIHIGNNQLEDIAGGNTAGIYTGLVDNLDNGKYNTEETNLKKELLKRKIWSSGKYYQFRR